MKKNLAGNEKGFTLIELIVIIVILGILAAVAIPKYQDLTNEASSAAAEGVLGAARGAATINFAKNLVTPGSVTPVDAANAQRLVDLIDTDYILTVSGNEVTIPVGGKNYVMLITVDESATAIPPRPATITKKGAAGTGWPE